MKFRLRKAASGPESESGSARSFPLSRIPVLQSLIVVGGLALVGLLVSFLLVTPAEKKVLEDNTQERADALRSRFNQHLNYLHDVVAAFAAQDSIRAAVTGGDDRENAARILQDTLPAAETVFLFEPGNVSQPEDRSWELGFASIDLARQAERDGESRMDAFQRDGSWFVQIAAPVGGSGGGSLLVIFDDSVMDPVLSAAGVLDGFVALRQRVEGREVPVFTQGSGQGDGVTRDLAISGWSVRYRPASRAPELITPAALWGVLAVVAVLIVGGIWMVFGRLQKQLRQDVSGLSQWAQKAFEGDRLKPPELRVPAVRALAETLQRLARERPAASAGAGGGSRRKAASSGPAAAPATGGEADLPEETDSDSEPLFGDDALDIDMLNGDEDVLGLGDSDSGGDTMSLEENAAATVDVPDSIFRAYDIRGVVGDSLTPEIVETIGRAIGSEALQRRQHSICVGYDGRHSSPDLAEALTQGVLATGVDVIRIGRVPTPVLYFATHYLETGSGVMITGSHNPPEYNGLKMMLGGDTLAGDAIQDLLTRIRHNQLEEGQGERSDRDVRKAYIDTIVGDIAVAAPLRVVVDAGNGVAGELGPELIRELGCEVTPLYCDVDGNFPNHHPDPGKPENLASLIQTVQNEGADLGIAFDGDGDRLGVVTNSGKIIWPDRLLMLFARDVVSRNPGADIIYDVKCSRRLASVVNEYGGRPVIWKTGHSWIKAKMKEMGALLAGEMSGHIFFRERWYGFDDGIYAAARLLEILGIEDREADTIFAEFPEDESTPEINLAVADDDKFALIERLASGGDFGEASITDLDGLRVDYPDGWGLCRASNTTPNLVLRFEAQSGEALERIKGVFRQQLQKAEPSLQIPF
ncbi:phosphomannomutase/phosphoglucomutase [Salicola sp. Rm-C-2C1-2]|uniref:phosphomannomutase/phosphoglucomutase n=1 Tax=Salicola sp. Rm-C-2C1-2 TaxID=3141321 RepID=UPI0032E3DB8A